MSPLNLRRSLPNPPRSPRRADSYNQGFNKAPPRAYLGTQAERPFFIFHFSFILSSMPNVFIRTYGCQMNERDSEQVARDLQDRGHRLVQREQEADVILLNTCSVREMAEQKAIGKMGMLKKLRREKPKLVLGYMGCMAQRLGEALEKHSPHVDLVVGTQKFHRVADYVEEALRKREEAFAREDLADLGSAINPTLSLIHISEPTRPY